MGGRRPPFVSPGQFSSGFHFLDTFAGYVAGPLTGQGGWLDAFAPGPLSVASGGPVSQGVGESGNNTHPLPGFDPLAPWVLEIDTGPIENGYYVYVTVGDSSLGNVPILSFQFAGSGMLNVGVECQGGAVGDDITFAHPTAPVTVRLEWDGTNLTASVGSDSVQITPTLPFDSDPSVFLEVDNFGSTAPLECTRIEVTQ